jgi:signal peptidase I
MSLEPQQPEPQPSEIPQDAASNSALQENPENFWVETIKTIGIAVVLALGMRQFVAEARYIPSGSMEPTMLVDDRLIIDKVSYRFSDPQRGDIVVFDPTPNLKSLGYNEAFIKRVIGLPGDKVEVHNDKAIINGQPLAENYPSQLFAEQMNKIYADKQAEIDKRNQKRKLDKNNKEPLEAEARRSLVPTQDYQGIVPAGQYLVLGDHRNGSYDGRSWGFVPKGNIVGKAVVRFWPLNRMGGIDPKPSYVK